MVVDCKHVTASFVHQGFPVASIGELGGRFVNLYHAPRTTREYYMLLTEGARRPRPGDLIMSRNATVGRVARVSTDHPPFAMGQDVCLLRPKPSACSPQFLQAVLQSPAIGRQFEAMMAGSTFKRMNVQQIKKLEILLPSIEEQERISEVLASTEDLISTLERLIAKKQAIKQGLMQQLLTGKIRLPGFLLPWRPRRLSEMLSYEQPGRYLVQASKPLDAGHVPVLTAGKTFILGYTNETHGIYTAHPVIIFDDFTTASKHVDFDFKAKSSAMKILSARTGANLRFVYERMQLIDFPLGDHKRHWISEYSKQEILVPDEPEQAAIAEVLSDSEAEVAALRERLSKAKAVKQGMMQQLLTGRTRLTIKEGAA
ncbi:restriction endonuclease subunit S [Sphaerimonospora thailandensis]|uniref:restriction endonuclease subunit S n=1 Tax=Sphaerimonospora thailandensis TaxID=795644 RepID=UPI00195121F9|nr:restriction endonuclease subunit S [Sphaerimonospora thailandensis]